MQYTLITPNGKIMQFYLKAMAEVYQRLNGGVVVSNDIFEVKEIENV